MLNTDCADRVAALVPLPHRVRVLSGASKMWRGACKTAPSSVDVRHMRCKRAPRAVRLLTRFVSSQQRVVSLVLAGSFWVTDDRLTRLFASCAGTLRSLDVQRCLLLRGDNVTGWPRGLLSLETVSSGMTKEGMAQALDSLPNLRTLRLGPERVVTTPCVQSTGAYFSRITDETLRCVAARRLAVVSLARCREVADVVGLCGGALQDLDLRWTMVTDEGVAEILRRAPELRRLAITKCQMLTRSKVAQAVKSHGGLRRVEADGDVLRQIVFDTGFEWSCYGSFVAPYSPNK